MQQQSTHTQQRSGGELLVESLFALGASKSFGIPGESYLAVLDALHDYVGRLDFVLCRHEGGAAYMAAAYGKLTGTPGICFVTRGPGSTNAAIGVHTAKQDSAPMLLFVGQVGTGMKGREAFQEIDYPAVFGSMAKWAVEIDRVERIPEILSRAWMLATTGRPGPVVIALPEDVLSDRTETQSLSGPAIITEPTPGVAAIDKTLALLQQAQRPLILIGGCNWSTDGSLALQRFATASDIPVIVAFRYHDQFDNHASVFCGEAGVGMPAHVHQLLSEADTILALNVRFGEISTAAYTLFSVPVPEQTLIHVHASDLEIGKVYQPALGVHAGHNAFALALLERKGVESIKSTREGKAHWRAQARAAYEASFNVPEQPSPVDMVSVCAWLRKHLPGDVILTDGAGNFAVWPNKFFQFGPRARLLAPQSGAMGYGLPAAIAAKIHYPERTVVCFTGDGDFQMTSAELATASQANAQPIILLINNGIYGTIRAHQEKHYPTRVFGTRMTQNPDFVALAKAYGFHAERVEATKNFPAAFQRAQASKTGALLDLNISPEAITPHLSLSQIRQAALKQNKHVT